MAIVWNDRCQWSFENLKCLCTMVPILAYANFTRPFKLHTDTCGSAMEAVLYQTHDDGMDAVIACASRSLTKAESHYHAHKLGFLTLKRAGQSRNFMNTFTGQLSDVYTDNNVNDGQAGCCEPPMGDHLGQFQLSIVL